MHYSMKKAEKAVQTVRQTARDTKIAVKKTAKAVTHAIKALIEATKALLSALTAGGWIAVMILIIVILFGGFLCMTGGDNSSTVSSVSAEVEAYEPLISQYANQYAPIVSKFQRCKLQCYHTLLCLTGEIKFPGNNCIRLFSH